MERFAIHLQAIIRPNQAQGWEDGNSGQRESSSPDLTGFRMMSASQHLFSHNGRREAQSKLLFSDKRGIQDEDYTLEIHPILRRTIERRTNHAAIERL